MAFVKPTIYTLAPMTLDIFATKSHKIKYFKDIEYDKITTLEVRVKAEGVNLYDPVRATKMCLILNVVVSKKIHVPKFIKYTETQCPSTHLKSYSNKMVVVTHDKKHFFQDSLSGAVTLNLYMRLDNIEIQSLKDLIIAFIKQYKYNMDIASDRSSQFLLIKKERETMCEYAQQLRDLAGKVHPYSTIKRFGRQSTSPTFG